MNLSEHLHSEHKHLRQLINLLGGERELLVADDVDGPALAALAAQKNSLLQTLANLEKQRLQLRDQHGYASDRSGDELLARANGCQSLWREVLTLSYQTAQANRFNGRLIDARMVTNQRILNELQTLAGRDLYDQAGQSLPAGGRISSRA